VPVVVEKKIQHYFGLEKTILRTFLHELTGIASIVLSSKLYLCTQLQSLQTHNLPLLISKPARLLFILACMTCAISLSVFSYSHRNEICQETFLGAGVGIAIIAALILGDYFIALKTCGVRPTIIALALSSVAHRKLRLREGVDIADSETEIGV